MPTEIMTGLAVLHGIQNDGTAISMTGYATFVMDKISARHMFNLKDFQDENDFDVSSIATNEHAEITIDFTPTGATKAAAAAIPTFPVPLASVTLAHVKVQGAISATAATKMFDGAYQYRGGASVDLSKNDFGKVSGITLRKYVNVAQNASMVTTVS